MPEATIRKPRLSLRITIRIERDGKSFHAWAPALKGLHVDGPTKKEALEAARQAVQAYLNSLVRHGEPLPIGFDQAMRSKTTRSSASDSHNITLQWPSLRTSGIN